MIIMQCCIQNSTVVHCNLVKVNMYGCFIYAAGLWYQLSSCMQGRPEMRKANQALPTFLYVMPFSSTKLFLEETSLVSRPPFAFQELKERLQVRYTIHLKLPTRSMVCSLVDSTLSYLVNSKLALALLRAGCAYEAFASEATFLVLVVTVPC